MSRGPREDEGAATPVVLGLCAVLSAVAVLLTALASVAVARHRAAAAADLAALAAAGAVLEGEPAACARAGQVASAQGGRLVSCALTGELADVVVEVRPPGRLGELGTARVRARAGPAR